MPEGEHTHPEQPTPPTIPLVTPVVNTGSELVQPVVDHGAKIATLEEKQSQYEDKLFSEISSVRSDLYSAIENSTSGWSERIAGLESRLEELLAKAAEIPAEETGGGPPDVEVEQPAPVIHYIRRNGRKVKREG